MHEEEEAAAGAGESRSTERNTGQYKRRDHMGRPRCQQGTSIPSGRRANFRTIGPLWSARGLPQTFYALKEWKSNWAVKA